MSETATVEEPSVKAPDFLRQSAFISPQVVRDFTILIIGAGAVGSHTAMNLARMGFCNFIVVDFDDVQAHNLPNQSYRAEDIGKKKVDALRDNLLGFNPNINISCFDAKWGDAIEKAPWNVETLPENIIPVIATDNLLSRRLILDWCRKNVDSLPLGFYEARLSFEYAQIGFWDLNSSRAMKNYAQLVSHDDKDVPEGPCNRKICGTFVIMVSAVMASNICHDAVSFISGQDPADLRNEHNVIHLENNSLISLYSTGIKPPPKPVEVSP
jgi:molybdopterin/thiamine biosynthesis adenylyltransferase